MNEATAIILIPLALVLIVAGVFYLVDQLPK